MEETPVDIGQIALVNCPLEFGNYRFVQFYGPNDLPIARVGIFSEHPQIAVRFCQEAGIDAKYDHEKKKFWLPEDCGYKLVGAGFCGIYPEEKIVAYGDNSMSLKMYPDPEHLEKLMKHFPEWTLKQGIYL